MENKDREIRKLRKKLRQIENLELLSRSLNEEELIKIQKKDSVRKELAVLLNLNAESPVPVEQQHVKSDAEVTVESQQKNETPERTEKANSIDDMKRLEDPVPVMSNDTKKKRLEESRKTKESGKLAAKQKEQKTQPKAPLFWVHKFVGHSDLVTSVAMNEDYLVSASRDTCIKAWDLKTESEPSDLRGHTNFVTAIKFLPHGSSSLLALSDNTSSGLLLISASLDCCVKLWDVENSKMLRSIYTFNGITALDLIKDSSLFAIGTEGGKLEIYDLNHESNSPVWSAKAFSDSVTCLQITQGHMYSASLDGIISVWELNTEFKISPRLVYKSENLKTETGVAVLKRPVRSLCVPGPAELIYFGDEGSNLKVLNWKTDKVRKLANHVIGVTNSISSTENLLLVSSFNLETGVSSVNVRSLPDEAYLYTLSLQRQNRIVSIAAFQDDTRELLRIATGGSELTVWETMNFNKKMNCGNCKTSGPLIRSRLSLPAEDTEDSDPSSSETEEDQEPGEKKDVSSGANDKRSWCIIM